jgi:outer membrane protein, heavy metal efflux system
MESVSQNRTNIRLPRCLTVLIGMVAWLPSAALAQKTFTWEQAKRELEATNPNLRASRIGVQEARADEITAYLRPNPDLTVVADQFTPFNSTLGAAGTYTYRPLSQVLPLLAGSYLIERQHKRSLRRESAQGATAIAASQLADQERNLLFDLRTAFVQVLAQKAVLAVTQESLAYYDRVLDVSRERLKVGDIAQVDLDRLELLRVQFATDVQTALVSLRTAKIQFRALLNDRTPIEKLDVVGPFDYRTIIPPLEELRQTALANRPDLKAAEQAVTKARTDYRLARANGSTDPTIGWDLGRDPPDLPAYIGFSINIPLRIFDRNQGEKLRTRLDIGLNEQLVDATKAQILSDVDSSYAAIESNLILLRPYTSQYLQLAARVRDTIAFSYQRGGASLLDFLGSQQDYRAIQLAYVNLVATFLTAAAQMNVAAGIEVIQ